MYRTKSLCWHVPSVCYSISVCFDVPQCQFNPCYPGVRCINTAPGFRCESCPRGYTGPEVRGVGIAYAQANRQVSHHSCTQVSACVQTRPCKACYTKHFHIFSLCAKRLEPLNWCVSPSSWGDTLVTLYLVTLYCT